MDVPHRGSMNGDPERADEAAPGPAVPTHATARASLVQAETPAEVARVWLDAFWEEPDQGRRGVVLIGPADRGPYAPIATWPPGRSSDDVAALLPLAEQCMTKGTGLQRGRPSGRALLSMEGPAFAEPLLVDGSLHGAVAIEYAPQAELDAADAADALRLAMGWLQAIVRWRLAQEGMGHGARLETVLTVLASALESKGFQGASMALATELATLLDCDRVSVGTVNKNRVRVAGLSHSAQFGKRTNLIAAIEAAMEEAIDYSTTLVAPAPHDDLAGGLRAHTELLHHFGTESACTVLLSEGHDVTGAITLERKQPFDPATTSMLEATASLLGPVLEARRENDQHLLAKIWHAGRGFAKRLVGPRHVALKLASAAVIGTLAFLTFATGTFRVSAGTIVEPIRKRAAVAAFDGYVNSAPARAGDVVEAGRLLGSLDDRDLQLERARWESELAQAMKQYRQALAERDAAQTEIEAAAIEESRAELDRIAERLTRVELRAPFDGVVVTGDLSQRLGAPVQRGDVLFEVAPLDAYRLILRVDESDVAHVREGQTGHVILSSLPEESFEFNITKITPISEAEEGQNTFRVEAELRSGGSTVRPGMEGVAKVEVDERRLVWIWTHELIEWMRVFFWKWTP